MEHPLKKQPTFSLVAEVKTQSPFGFRSSHTRDELFDIANEHGDIISIHTHPAWGGSFEWLKEARHRTDKPILAKGIHPDNSEIYDAFNLGADYVLCVGRIPQVNRLSDVWYEPHTLRDVHNLIANPPKIHCVVWNSRDLYTGLKKSTMYPSETINGALALTPPPIKVCQASMVSEKSDVFQGVDYVLIGEKLVDYIKS